MCLMCLICMFSFPFLFCSCFISLRKMLLVFVLFWQPFSFSIFHPLFKRKPKYFYIRRPSSHISILSEEKKTKFIKVFRFKLLNYIEHFKLWKRVRLRNLFWVIVLTNAVFLSLLDQICLFPYSFWRGKSRYFA